MIYDNRLINCTFNYLIAERVGVFNLGSIAIMLVYLRSLPRLELQFYLDYILDLKYIYFGNYIGILLFRKTVVCAAVANCVLRIVTCGSIAPVCHVFVALAAGVCSRLIRFRMCRSRFSMVTLLSQLCGSFIFSSSGAPLNSLPPMASIIGGCLLAVCVNARQRRATLAGVFVEEIL